ncbi:DUF871 domain-containing protein [Lacticaseibacillus nasuensis]|uniref:DUF871 domain-containing protein n=1 Tax=Lacticaseibacillus nasuensis TaxID=944671 RepID=UPI0006D185C8|nr:MupG family TIM beta-alpha barrel fold protein [Lacticaseibacillus nasuensis]
MARLGISLYPEQSTPAADRAYLQLAHELGYRRVFTSLLQLTSADGEDLVAPFRDTVAFANQLGFAVIADVNPALFSDLGITYQDLSWFDALGVWGIRLDEGFTGSEEAAMTRNPFGLKIELNMSHGGQYLANILSYSPNRANLIGCHNFYPQQYTGLGDARFTEYSQPYREAGLTSAAFVTSHEASFGPWPVNEGLPTLESDRERPIASQVMHLRLTDAVSDILIGNAYASDAELRAAAAAFSAPNPGLQVELAPDITAIEREIVLLPAHLYRGDASDYLIRDTQPRVTYRAESISARAGAAALRRGDVVVVNNDYARYKGECQIVLRPVPNDGRRNVVGHIAQSDLALLDELRPWQQFDLLAD